MRAWQELMDDEDRLDETDPLGDHIDQLADHGPDALHAWRHGTPAPVVDLRARAQEHAAERDLYPVETRTVRAQPRLPRPWEHRPSLPLPIFDSEDTAA